jgi:hypothetical protein
MEKLVLLLMRKINVKDVICSFAVLNLGLLQVIGTKEFGPHLHVMSRHRFLMMDKSAWHILSIILRRLLIFLNLGRIREYDFEYFGLIIYFQKPRPIAMEYAESKETVAFALLR